MKNWRTTLVGAITAIVIAVAPVLETGNISWKAIIVAALVAIGGYLAKDAGVSGRGV